MPKRKGNPSLVQLPMFEPVTIKLTKGYVAVVDPVDADLATLKWGAWEVEGRVYATKRATRSTNGNNKMHRLIMERILNRQLRRDELVDHIDNNPLNNRRNNLRLATKTQNGQNAKRSKRNTSGYKGVYRNNTPWGKRWRAVIHVNGKQIFLGTFDKAEDAHTAYVDAARKHFGEFARTE